RHPGRVEAALEHLAAASSIQMVDVSRRGDRILERIDDETRHPIVNHLGNGAATKRDDGDAARERLDHDETKRFWPVDWKHQCGRLPQKRTFLVFGDLADELHERIVQKRAYLVLEV